MPRREPCGQCGDSGRRWRPGCGWRPCEWCHDVEYTRWLEPQRALVAATLLGRRAFDAIEAEAKRRMETLAASLPVAAWASDIHGLGMCGLAQIVAEAGNLSNYAGPAKLWKRMGVAVRPDGRRQGSLPKGAPKADWAGEKYNPARRAVLQQIGKNGIVMQTASPYRPVYEARKAYERELAEAAGMRILPAEQWKRLPEAERERAISLKRIDDRARRYAEKRLLRDLWRAWRAEARGDLISTIADMPPPADEPEAGGG